MHHIRATLPDIKARISQSLAKFQYCHQLVQMELEMQQGTLLSLSRDEAERARAMWGVHNTGMELISTSKITA